MTYKAIVLDMDGTMLNEQNRVSDNLNQLLKELRRRGTYVFIATGRTPREIKDVAPADLEVDGYVTSNGMAVYLGEELLVQHALSPSLVHELVEEARKREIYYEVHPNTGARVSLEADRGYFDKQITDPKPETVEINEWLSRKNAMNEQIEWQSALDAGSVAKIYFFSRDLETIQQFRSDLEVRKQETAFATFSSTEHNVEIMVANVSKATGIKLLLDRFSITNHEIVAVGDSENDLPMFQYAGHAVAMKNAAEHVKKHADEVTPHSYREDGLYHYLKNLFLV
ncbi:HAD family hydrolase [Brevibacillus migulae]|uniref:HAD family hydrolase n=1 Tax=Brevibacillus migulae TaxID=1644114 RepID=UPI00106DDE0E|nr:HAD family hydrolase [Brevibacillus migulae]